MLIALDLEATLIDNSISATARPGLHAFAEFCQENFDRVVLFTTVDEADAREALYSLADSGDVPDSFTSVPYVNWHGRYKDLRFADDENPENILLVDDDINWIHPDQTKQWIPITPWMGEPGDTELIRVKQILAKRLSG